ncbi:MAG: D-glycero-beta-D-manno-heptose 1-phosphate adenylyltransferase [Bacteroidota bacterium]
MATKNKVLSQEETKQLIVNWQRQGEKVVFTNGCFDILHLGHIDYLEKAAQQGDRLIVAVNTDASVRKLKGETRPLNNEYARCRLLAALAFTDAIVLFSEDTPLTLIETLKPDVLIKGADYSLEQIVGADVVIAKGGEVRTIELVEGYSTTGLVEKIKNS